MRPGLGRLMLAPLSMSSRTRLRSPDFEASQMEVLEVRSRTLPCSPACCFSASRFFAAFDTEDDHGAAFASQVFLVALVIVVRFQAWIADPFDSFVLGQMLRDGQRVFAVLVHAQWQCLNAL